MIHQKIVEEKKKKLVKLMNILTLSRLEEMLELPDLRNTLDFLGAIKRQNTLSIIAEIKKASPTKGIIRENLVLEEILNEYLSSAIQAISVLTEEDFFQGSNENIINIRQACTVPILRKDFIIDVWQIYESRIIGADAILLIVSILSSEQLKFFIEEAKRLNLCALVEVHDRYELEIALEAGADAIGINNRDLKSFTVELKTTQMLMRYIPTDKVVVSESGISTYKDMQYLESLGIDAVLIGEALMKAHSIKLKIKELRGEL